MSATGRPRDGGFTLIEALVVVALTAAIGAILYPELSRSLDQLSARQSVLLMAADLRDARAAALRTGQRVEVRVASDGATYTAGRTARSLPAALRLRAADPAVSFFADGSSSGAPISLWVAGRPRLRLAVDPVSGDVSEGPA